MPADAFAAIADPTRRRILELLEERDVPVNELARQFNVSRPAISQHLRVLERAGLVGVARVGRERRYRLEPAALAVITQWVQRFERRVQRPSETPAVDAAPESQADGA